MQKVFIVGVGRSGTSLLQSMLNSHSRICFIPETHFLRKYVFKKMQMIEDNDVSKTIELLNADEDFLRAKISAKDIVNPGRTFKQVYDILLSLYLKRKEKEIIGDKDPRNIDFINQLYSNYPQSKIIHIIRDPRDVILSRTKANWSKNTPFFLHAYLYYTQTRRGMLSLRKLPKDTYLEIFYEDLINSPVNTLKRVSSFLNVEYENSMLEFSSSSKELVSESELQWKKETLGPLLKNNSNKWKNNLSNDQIGLIQHVCKNVFVMNMYKADKEVSISWIFKIFHGIMSKLFCLLYPLRLRFLKR